MVCFQYVNSYCDTLRMPVNIVGMLRVVCSCPIWTKTIWVRLRLVILA